MGKRSSHSDEHRIMRLAMLLLLSIIIVAALFYFFDISIDDITETADTLLNVQDEVTQTPQPKQASPAPTSADASMPAESETGSVYPVAGKLSFVVLDVDQGDSIFVQTPSGKTMLIDCGEAEAGSIIDDYLHAAKVERIDVLIATHPHSDHIGGMRQIVRNYEIGQVWMPKVSHSTSTYEKLLEAIADKGLKVKTAKSGKSIELSSDVTVRLLGPVRSDHEEMNDNSAVIRIDYQNSSFLVTGDIEEEAELEVIEESAELLDIDVLKVAHHGSSTSTCAQFLEAATPEYGIISCGYMNSYDHPSSYTLERLDEYEIPYYRTDYSGTIAVITDGKELRIVAEKSNAD